MLKKHHALLCGLLAASSASFAVGTSEEAQKLGTELTCWGAPKGASGNIPAWTGSPKAPAGFVPGSGIYPNPFASDKPLFSITAANLAQYADKLGAVQKELLKRYPDYRIDVYPTRRTYDEPKELCDAARKNVLNAKTTPDGLELSGAFGALPFPFPKTGYEVMWNHLMPWRGSAVRSTTDSLYVDRAGRQVHTAKYLMQLIFPYYMPGKDAAWFEKEAESYYYMALGRIVAPASINGEGFVSKYSTKPMTAGDKRWGYQPGQRRVRITPDANYDFPVASAANSMVTDDLQVFYGPMDRFAFKLIGKKEMYIPYNNYDLMIVDKDKLLGKNFLNPDFTRFELRRVWVVEATLKEGYRHIYSKRVFYFEEDNPAVGFSDQYDMSGKLFRSVTAPVIQVYDQNFPFSTAYFSYDLSGGVYHISRLGTDGKILSDKPNPDAFTPQNLQSVLSR
ncbi:DUF1329 domain-containing protein [Noviherbaspirillum sedimenti]|uniref:DUF1329 domain-containing protein n=1 Tax=Noviherbaspirillum sedimenti TaxID=2320865 RepID=A0A3A3G3M2_9BURK|nr:DUF1329 domain-containing protein [Noviherbaspirillum sedimenti]RJG03088.1 DUF1329 domain-containing protein [Noviherbaspirillum sedimenti]